MRRAAGVVVAKRAVVEKTTAATTVRRRCAAFVFGGGGGDDCFLRSMSRLEGALNVDAKNDDDDDDDAFSRIGVGLLRVSAPCSNVKVGGSFMNVGRGVVGEDEVAEFPGYAPPGVDVVLMAVPKAKVTPSRKKRRNQFKKVEFVRDARKCPTCRKPMRSWHNFCCPPKDEKEDVVYSTTE